MDACPNCGRPVETHEMFNPPRCPVVRIRWLEGGAATTSSGVLTRKMLDDSFAAIAKQGSRPTHECRFDGHVMQWNPLGFHWCIYCHMSEADVERPS